MKKEEGYIEVVVKLKEKIKKEEIQDLENNNFKYPLVNFDHLGRKWLPIFKPDFRKILMSHEVSFANKISEWRQLFKQSLLLSISSTFLTGYSFFKKSKYLNYFYFPTFSLYFASFYIYNLSYGNMINRVNIEAFTILNSEKKKYFSSPGSVKKALDEMEKVENK